MLHVSVSVVEQNSSVSVVRFKRFPLDWISTNHTLISWTTNDKSSPTNPECPCPANNSVLLLSTMWSSAKPMVIRSTGKNSHDSWLMSHIKEIFMRDSGDVNDDLNFEFGDGTVAHNGCGATLFGEFWYFGGGTGSTSANSQKRKVWNFTLGGAMESSESGFLKYISRWVKWSDANSSNNHWNWILIFTKDLVKHSGSFFRI